MIFKRFKMAFSRTNRRVRAAECALFAMMVQALIPFSSAIALPGADHETRQGRDLPGFYLVVCTAYGAQAQSYQAQTYPQADDAAPPVDDGTSAVMPWDCPVCQTQTLVQGPTPETPDVAFRPYPLPLGGTVPRESDRVQSLWTAAPGLARAPPHIL